MSLVDRALAGDFSALARLATIIENGGPTSAVVDSRIYPASGSGFSVGVTGPPGAGKSSFINAAIARFRSDGHRVGVIAVDPTSPLSGGATLGDRIRMSQWHADPGVFVRSVAARGGHGGVANTTPGIIHLLDACGFDRVMVETIGIGQADVEVTRFVDCTVLLQSPGQGDTVQAMKAGILEMADIVVVHKADLPGAEILARQLRSTLALGSESGHIPTVISASSETGAGIEEVVAAIEAFRADAIASGTLGLRRQAIAAAEILAWTERIVARRLAVDPNQARSPLVEQVATRQATPSQAAALLLAESEET